jgi:hypothetical protein
MRKRIKSATVVLAALTALALGGSALATAAGSSSRPAQEKVSTADPGPAVQQGDQTTPDGAVAAKKKATAKHHGKKHGKKGKAAANESQPGSDPAGPNDTTSPDTGSAASENTAENASETAPGDGPGGPDGGPTVGEGGPQG